MLLKQKEDDLFKKWEIEQTDGLFIRDGIVDENEFKKSDIKIMFILKEPNDPDGQKKWDLRDFIKKNTEPYNTWVNIHRWVYGIKNLKKDIKWKDLEQMDHKKRPDELKSICVINVKKIPGGNTSDYNILREYSSTYKNFLQEQFQIYETHLNLIICCGSGIDEIFEKFILQKSIDWTTSNKGIKYSELAPNEKRYVISYIHPQARMKNCFLYYGYF